MRSCDEKGQARVKNIWEGRRVKGGNSQTGRPWEDIVDRRKEKKSRGGGGSLILHPESGGASPLADVGKKKNIATTKGREVAEASFLGRGGGGTV